MSMNWIRVTLKQLNLGVVTQAVFDYRTATTPTVPKLIDFLGTWDSDVLPAVNNIQHEGVTNIALSAVWRGNAAVAYETTVDGNGGHSPGSANYCQPDMCFYIRKYPGESFPWDDEEEIGGYQIPRGALFLTGISDDWVTNGVRDIPIGLSSAYPAFQAAMIAVVNVDTDDYQPVVHSYAKLGVGGHPECYSDIVSVDYRRMTRQRNRSIF